MVKRFPSALTPRLVMVGMFGVFNAVSFDVSGSVSFNLSIGVSSDVSGTVSFNVSGTVSSDDIFGQITVSKQWRLKRVRVKQSSGVAYSGKRRRRKTVWDGNGKGCDDLNTGGSCR